MIFPKRDAVYQNLNTSFTNFGELLVDLKENGFTGVVQVSFWEYDGVLLLDNGSIVNAAQEAGGHTLSGQDAVKSVTEKAKEKDGSVSVFVQNGEMITMLASMVISKAVFENLSTDFTSLEALIGKLEGQDHTGYIEVRLEGNRQTGHIFMLEGRVIDALLSAGTEEVSGAKVLGRILEIISSSGATFSVFESAVEEALSESEIIKISYNLPQLLETWGVFIHAVETSTDEHLGAGEFLNTFKDILISNADEFPFLDTVYLSRLIRTYGTRARTILDDVSQKRDLGEDFGNHLYRREVEYLIKYELANCAEDILFRRTKLGIKFSEKQKDRLAGFMDERPWDEGLTSGELLLVIIKLDIDPDTRIPDEWRDTYRKARVSEEEI